MRNYKDRDERDEAINMENKKAIEMLKSQGYAVQNGMLKTGKSVYSNVNLKEPEQYYTHKRLYRKGKNTQEELLALAIKDGKINLCVGEELPFGVNFDDESFQKFMEKDDVRNRATASKNFLKIKSLIINTLNFSKSQKTEIFKTLTY